MKKKILYIILVIVVFISLIIGLSFLYSDNKFENNDIDENRLYGYWRYYSYQYYENDELIERLENITGEYLAIDSKSIKKCVTKDNNTIGCEEGTYDINKNYINVKSNNFTFAGNYKYEINNEKLILTQINDNNKYIYVYSEHEVIK